MIYAQIELKVLLSLQDRLAARQTLIDEQRAEIARLRKGRHRRDDAIEALWASVDKHRDEISELRTSLARALRASDKSCLDAGKEIEQLRRQVKLITQQRNMAVKTLVHQAAVLDIDDDDNWG